MTRRALLAGLPLAATHGVAVHGEGRGVVLTTPRGRFADAATEFEVVRLTDPSYASRFPAYYNRSVSTKGNFLVYCSNRSEGRMQAFRMDFKSGESKQVTEATGLDPASVALLPDEKTIVYADGAVLRQTNLGNLKDRDLHRADSELGAGVAVSEDALFAACVERSGSKSRLRLISLARGSAQTAVEMPGEIAHPMPRPKRAGVAYQLDGGVWLVGYDGQQNRRLKLASGRILSPQWSPDGRALTYLVQPEEKGRLSEIHEFTPDTNADTLLARTSQFGAFKANSDASVFIGASTSKAAPYVLLLLRVTRRELTLCEHRASDPLMASPIFSPSSQRIYFQSDRGGNSALYTMAIEKLVERTEAAEQTEK